MTVGVLLQIGINIGFYRLPKIAELADPRIFDDSLKQDLSQVDPDAPDPRKLFRVHWHNDATRRRVSPRNQSIYKDNYAS